VRIPENLNTDSTETMGVTQINPFV